jgi:hypothetical protein
MRARRCAQHVPCAISVTSALHESRHLANLRCKISAFCPTNSSLRRLQQIDPALTRPAAQELRKRHRNTQEREELADGKAVTDARVTDPCEEGVARCRCALLFFSGTASASSRCLSPSCRPPRSCSTPCARQTSLGCVRNEISELSQLMNDRRGIEKSRAWGWPL